MGGTAGVLPPDGVDLRAVLADQQCSLVEQALARSEGDLQAAAKLLRLSPLELTRLHAGLRAPSPDTRGRTGSRVNGSRVRAVSPVVEDEIPRIERGREIISAGAIRRLARDGFSEKQIASRLGCNYYVIEKVLRMQRESTELRKCGPLPPEREQ
jgi:hypothetical protein